MSKARTHTLACVLKNSSLIAHQLRFMSSEECAAVHARLAAVSGVASSTHARGVSVHKLGESARFDTLRAMLRAAGAQSSRLLLGVLDSEVVVSLNFSLVPRAAPAAASKKRGREPEYLQAEASVKRLRGSLGGTAADDAQLTGAKASAVALQTRVRGANGEKAVESYSLRAQKPGEASDTAPPPLILSARFAPGVAVAVEAVRSALLPLCFGDGMLTSRSLASFSEEFRLPLGPAAQIASDDGERSLALFATVGTPTPRVLSSAALPSQQPPSPAP